MTSPWPHLQKPYFQIRLYSQVLGVRTWTYTYIILKPIQPIKLMIIGKCKGILQFEFSIFKRQIILVQLSSLGESFKASPVGERLQGAGVSFPLKDEEGVKPQRTVGSLRAWRLHPTEQENRFCPFPPASWLQSRKPWAKGPGSWPPDIEIINT